MIRFLTAGESHGKSLNTIVEGFPSNLEIDSKYINAELKRRQGGYGRGMRMQIETDTAEILSGVRFGKTLGSPISIVIQNSDWVNWKDEMSSELNNQAFKKITIPRPGHADLMGVTKYNFDDIRNSIERSSARETAARVAVGAVAKKFLREFGIEIGSFVESIGGVFPIENFAEELFNNDLNRRFSAKSINLKADKSSVRVLDEVHEKKIINKIKIAKKKGDTLGGTFYTIATGLPIGLGSFVHYDTKLNSSIAQAIMSINAVKGVEIGEGFLSAEKYGSESHDEIIKRRNVYGRKTNRSGGIEGGISTGLPIIVRAAMKPIATLMSPIQTVDLANGKKILARRERSDFVAVPACAVVSESMLAWVIADFFIRKFGNDSIEDIKANYKNYITDLENRLERNFKN